DIQSEFANVKSEYVKVKHSFKEEVDRNVKLTKEISKQNHECLNLKKNLRNLLRQNKVLKSELRWMSVTYNQYYLPNCINMKSIYPKYSSYKPRSNFNTDSNNECTTCFGYGNPCFKCKNSSNSTQASKSIWVPKQK
ncbi:hypothetical protein LINGRAHAP2_LOCUS13994, partial [Linum grandiflorum]